MEFLKLLYEIDRQSWWKRDWFSGENENRPQNVTRCTDSIQSEKKKKRTNKPNCRKLLNLAFLCTLRDGAQLPVRYVGNGRVGRIKNVDRRGESSLAVLPALGGPTPRKVMAKRRWMKPGSWSTMDRRRMPDQEGAGGRCQWLHWRVASSATWRSRWFMLLWTLFFTVFRKEKKNITIQTHFRCRWRDLT